MEQPNLPLDFVDLLAAFGRAEVRRASRALLDFGAPAEIAAHLEAAIADEVVWMGHPPIDARNLELGGSREP